jgi:hypothetical protein
VVFYVIKSPHLHVTEEILIDALSCISEIFHREPLLVIKAYESGFDFQILIDSSKMETLSWP